MYPTNGRCWTFGQDDMLRYMNEWCDYELKDLDDADKRSAVCGISSQEVRKNVKGIVLSIPLNEARKKAQAVYDRGQWPKFYFTKGGNGGVRRKTYLSAVGGKLPTNFWPYADVGHTDEAKKELISLFEVKAPFDTPKPTRLLDRILYIATDKDSLVMDFFSGAATTAHSVMKQNSIDGGHRRFIMVQIPEKSASPEYPTLCEIGKERIRRAGQKIRTALFEEGGNYRHVAKAIQSGEQRTLFNDGKPVATIPVIPPRWSKIDETEDNKAMAQALDIGFRVLKLADSNMNDVYYSAEDYGQQMLDDMESKIKPDRTDLDLLFGCLLEWGLPLSLPYKSETIDGCTVHTEVVNIS